jgi:hypothetical protein
LDSPNEFPTTQTSGGGDASSVASEPQVSESASNAVESPAVPTGEGMATAESTPKLIPETDLNNLRSTYDKKLAEQQKAMQLIQQQFQALAQQKEEQDRLLFEQQIAQMPVEQQGPARQQFEMKALEQRYQAMLQQEKLKNQQFMQSVEPLARQAVIDELSKQYNAPKEVLSQFDKPEQMEAAAKAYKIFFNSQVAQKRVEKKADTFESTNKGASVTPNIVQDLRHSNKLEEYFARRGKG